MRSHETFSTGQRGSRCRAGFSPMTRAQSACVTGVVAMKKPASSIGRRGCPLPNPEGVPPVPGTHARTSSWRPIASSQANRRGSMSWIYPRSAGAQAAVDERQPDPHSGRRGPATTPVARRYTCSMASVRRLLTLLLLAVPGTQRLIAAQDVSVKLGFARTIKSAILNEDRRVLVHLPAAYDTSGKSYPVLYLLDGTQSFLLEMIAVTGRLRYDDSAPEMIIVAIENTDRDRDMMPVKAKGFPGPPRAEAFLALTGIMS